MKRNLSFRWWLASFLAILISNASVWSAEVAVAVSSNEAFVGVPIVLQVQIVYSDDYAEPVITAVDGLEIESRGQTISQSSVSSINGRVTRRSSVIHQFSVTAEREGTFTIPPITVDADGISQITKAVRIVAKRSVSGDLLRVEVTGARESAYAGEAVERTLQIWIKPYRDEERKLTLSEADMWRHVSQSSRWGIFLDKVIEFDKRRRLPPVKERLRESDDGEMLTYYVYEITAETYADRPGQFDASDIRIVVDYPTELGEMRDPFGGFFSGGQGRRRTLRVTATRPIVCDAEAQRLIIKPVPTAGRPEDYRGAVGSFQLTATATPLNVAAGDPISLHFGISGEGRLDVLRPPALAEQQDLISQFKVPDEELAGYVSGSAKHFTTSIRPRDENVAEIPPIRFSFFDPQREQFVSVKSDPIAIRVAPAETLDLGSTVAKTGDEPIEDMNAESSSAAITTQNTNVSGEEVLRIDPPASLSTAFPWGVFALPPLCCAFAVLILRRQSWLERLGRGLTPKRRLMRELSLAKQPDEIRDAVEGFLASVFRCPPDVDRRAWPIGQLRSRGLGQLAIRVERLYASAERNRFEYDVDDAEIASLLAEARDIADEMGGPRISTLSIRSPVSQAVGGLILACVVQAGMPSHGRAETVDSQPVRLTDAQRRAVLQEAGETYRSAIESPLSQRAELAQEAAKKYAILTESGIANAPLFFNLANAYRLSGDLANAIVNYRRALRWSPLNRTYQEALLECEGRLAATTNRAESDQGISAAEFSLQQTTRTVARQIPLAWTLAILFVCWCLVWATLLAKLLGKSFAWKRSVVATLAVGLFFAWISFPSLHEFTRSDGAILLENEVSLRRGDGKEFRVVSRIDQAAGRWVQVLNRRDQWLQVRLDEGKTGWIPEQAAALI